MPKYLAKKVNVFMLTDSKSTQGLEEFGVPILSYPRLQFEGSIRNHVAILDTDGRLITMYKVGSSVGFDPAYHMVDSILLNRGFESLEELHKIVYDTTRIPCSVTLTPQNPTISRFTYHPAGGYFEVFTNTESMFAGAQAPSGGDLPPTLLCVDTNGKIIHTSSIASKTASSDSIDRILFACLDDSWRETVCSIRFLGAIDTIAYGKHARLLSKYKQVVQSQLREKGQLDLIMPDLVGSFMVADNASRHLWIFDNKSALSGKSDTAAISIVNDSSFSISTLKVPMGFSKPEMYYTTISEQTCYILPNSGRLVRIDPEGSITYQTMTCSLPGLRICTYSSGAYIGVIQEVAGRRFAIFFTKDGQRVSDPIDLQSKTSYAALLASGSLISISSGDHTLKLCRAKIF
jgi:hypothetical protein